MNRPAYQGVILAAGHGSRMGPFGEQVPKPIAPICGKPLIVYQIEHMKALGIEDILVAVSRIQEYTAGMSLESFRDDQKTVDAVICHRTPKSGQPGTLQKRPLRIAQFMD